MYSEEDDQRGDSKIRNKGGNVRLDDWDIGLARRYIRPYFGSHKLSLHEDYSNPYGRDFFITFLGLMLYIVVVWR